MIVAERDGTRPLVSVVVPTYNSARTIERCVRALVTQATDHPFEVIVVDSGQDATLEAAAAVSSKIRTIRLPERAVAPAARNAGARAARGDILAFIDSDAYADDTWIDNVVRAADTGYDLVCGSIANANPRSAVARAEQLLMFNEFLPELAGGPYWFALSGNMLLRRSSFDRYGPFVGVRAAEDVVFSRRLLDAGGTVLFYPALRVAHENRTRLLPYFRNQFVVGKHTAIARRLVRFADTQRYWLFLALLPVAPAAKLAKIVGRLAVRSPRSLIEVGRQLPLLLAGIFAYSAGLVAGALTPSAKIHGMGGPSLDRIAAHERCASDSVKTA